MILSKKDIERIIEWESTRREFREDVLGPYDTTADDALLQKLRAMLTVLESEDLAAAVAKFNEPPHDQSGVIP